MKLTAKSAKSESPRPAVVKEFIPSLNGLRAISILMVIAYHFQQHHFFQLNKYFNFAGTLFFNGPLGVNVFFIISGFLITTLLKSESKRNNGISLQKFYIRRVIRIFPAYYSFIAVLLILQNINYFSLPPLAWVSMLTYTKQFFPFFGHSIEHFWSLSVEEVFYFIWPLCFIKIRNKRLFLLASISAIILLRFFLYRYPLATFTNSIFTTGDALLTGCLLATEIEFFKSLAKRFNTLLGFTPLAIFVSICIYNYAYHLGDGNFALKFLQKTAYSLFGSIGAITNFLVGLYVIHAVYSKGFLYRLLNTRVLNYIGLLSYSIYLWQQLFTDDKPWLHSLPLVVIIGIIFLVAAASYYLIEKPFLQLKHRFDTTARQRYKQ